MSNENVKKADPHLATIRYVAEAFEEVFDEEVKQARHLLEARLNLYRAIRDGDDEAVAGWWNALKAATNCIPEDFPAKEQLDQAVSDLGDVIFGNGNPMKKEEKSQ